jgi:uncharacterized protein YicC (UPF0701 family)
VFASLTVRRDGTVPVAQINEPVLAAVLAVLKELSGKVDAAPPTLDGILALKGVIEVSEAEESETERRAAEAAIVAGFGACDGGSRRHAPRRGQALAGILAARLAEIATLAARADAALGRKPEAVKARLAEQIATLLETSQRFDPTGCIRKPCCSPPRPTSARSWTGWRRMWRRPTKLIAGGGAVGRKLDFLAQELNRESNTLCAKANDVELTNIGLELKTVVEQFREQVQNLE